MTYYLFGMEMVYAYPYAFKSYCTSRVNQEIRTERTLIERHLRYN